MAPALVQRHLFGVKGDVVDGLSYLDDNLILYVCGHNTIVYNIDTKVQKFISGTEGTRGITAVAVSPTRRYIVVAESGEKGVISIFDLHTLKRRKVLTAPECGASEYVSLAFSSNKHLLAQGASPDWTLVLWQWEKAKLVSTVKFADGSSSNPSPAGLISRCSFNHIDPSLVFVSGIGRCSLMKIGDAGFTDAGDVFRTVKGGGSDLLTALDYTAHAWLQDDLLLAGTKCGKLALFQEGTFVAILASSPDDGNAIRCIAPFSKGFVAGSDAATLRVYEFSDAPNVYYTESKCHKVTEYPEDSIIALSLSPSEDVAAVLMSSNQICTVRLASSDIIQTSEDASFHHLSSSFHGVGSTGSAAITGMDTCARKPLVATCGTDQTVRVWNYLERSLELKKSFSEEAYSIAFHPSGLHILVGFSDKLRLMNLLMDDMRTYKEIGIKGCRECQFSDGGHLFAAVNGNTIQVFSTHTAECMLTMRGHNGKVRSLHWTADDTQIVSSGMDGAVYQWDLKENKREGEYVKKGCSYSTAVTDASGNAVFAAGSDKFLREMEFPASTVSKEIECNAIIGQIVLSHSQLMLFASTASPDRPGTVRSYKFPLTGDYTEYQVLSAPALRLKISRDDSYLFAAGADGALSIIEIRQKEKRGERESGRTPFSEEILVTKSDLEEKHTQMQELKSKVDELTLHNEYQLRLKDMNYNEQIKEVTEKFTLELEQDKNRYELLREEKNDLEMEFEEKLRTMEGKHHANLQDVESKYQKEIMREVERYQNLSQERDLLVDTWKRQQNDLASSHAKYVAEITEDYNERIEEDKALRLQMEDDIDDIEREFDETKFQLEGDIDQEIEELKAKYENKLGSERDATLRYKSENGIMKKRFSALQKDIELQREEIKLMLEKEHELVAQIRSLEKDIQHLKGEIRARDETIGDKEKRIYDLKKKNQELEKFKFVLDYRIKELKRQIEPRENEITDMKEQIKEMDHELEQYHKSNAALDLMIGELRQKLDDMQQTIMKQRQNLSEHKSKYSRFCSELFDCAQLIKNPRELRESITVLYKKHVTKNVKQEKLGSDIQDEYVRQREFLEKTVAALKRKLRDEVGAHKRDNFQVMQANMSMIKEINELRASIRTSKLALDEATARSAAVVMRKAARDRRHEVRRSEDGRGVELEFGDSRDKDDDNDYGNNDDARVIESQREEIGRLKERLASLKSAMQTADLRSDATLTPFVTHNYLTPRE